MKKIIITMCFLWTLLATYGQGSTCPPNIDFELGDFSHWQCMVGTTYTNDKFENVIDLVPSTPILFRHEIITAATASLDKYGNFPTLCPYGGNYSVKLGNEYNGREAEGLSYTFTVPTTVDTFTFTYFYAVVFENPGHPRYEQPRFFVSAYDVATGELVNCASFDYVSSSGIPGFEKSTSYPGVLFKRWTPASLQFAGLGGREVRLEFKTADCTQGAHFGYAYIDVGSACSNILATAPYCIETNSLILNAPYGFKNYTWYNQDFSQVVGNGQTHTLSPPPATSGVFYVDVEPYPGYGCRDTFWAAVTPLPVPDTPSAREQYLYCQGSSPPPLTAKGNENCEILWYTSPTGGIPTNIPPVPPTLTVGEQYYYVSQKVLFGCESFRRKITVRIVATPRPSFSINAVRQCLNSNEYIFTSTSTNLSQSFYSWDFGDGQMIDTGKTAATHKYDKAGPYTVRLKIVNEGMCTANVPMQVTVIPKPVASFSVPDTVCEKQTLVMFTDRSTAPTGGGMVNKWWWDIGGNIYQVKEPPGLIAQTPGEIKAKLVTTSTEGCISDTSSMAIPVRYKPGAAMQFSSRLCNNEVLNFTDVSAMPQGAAGESILKWYWKMDDTINFRQQHPALMLAPGNHTASMVTETNFGCTRQLDTVFTVHAKPLISLSINDSCVYRTIRYMAADRTNATEKWMWNMGNGFRKDEAVITRTYNKEGDRTLTLIGETGKTCRDTLYRPFAIYDNKAFAGRDTLVANNEPVHLNAHGAPGTKYTWTPSTGLNDAGIENPIAILDREQRYTLDALTKEGCDAHSQVNIKRYAGPDIYIPNAFTPNNDRVNDVFKVVPVGIKTFNYLVIYNRWGQVVFRTTDQNQGWDGRFNGAILSTGAFVAVSEAIDYKGKVMLRKRSIMLIR